MRTALPAILALALLAGGGRPVAAAAARDTRFAPAPAVLGQTGIVAVNSADILPPWETRVGLSALLATGSGGNRFDLLLTDVASLDKVLEFRGSVALGLPGDVEAALTVPYPHVEHGDEVTDGIGSMTVSAKLRVRDQAGWIPATAVSASWIADTGTHVPTSSISTNGYILTVPVQLAMGDPRWPVTIISELGGFWRDLGRPETDSEFWYGLAVTAPFARTGLLGDTGEYQFIAEINGTESRRTVTQEPDDVVSVAPGIRYLTEGWGVTATGILSIYELDSKKTSAGVLVEWHAVF